MDKHFDKKKKKVTLSKTQVLSFFKKYRGYINYTASQIAVCYDDGEVFAHLTTRVADGLVQNNIIKPAYERADGIYKICTDYLKIPSA